MQKLLLNGETVVNVFTAEVIQPASLHSAFLHATPKPNDIKLAFKHKKEFDALVIRTSARMIFME